jgi:hypothetical protein
MLYILVFLAILVSDIVWTKAIQNVARGKRFEASLFSSLLTGLGFFAVYFIIQDACLILVAMVAAFLGTFLMMGGKHDSS